MNVQDGVIAALFDIDGTLVDAHGAGRRSFVRALQDVFGIDDELQHVQFAGATDLNVFNQIMEEEGIHPSPTQRERFFASLALQLKELMHDHPATLLPGVTELLECMQASSRILMGLLTGNAEESARIKLGEFGLNRFFAFGGFGKRHADRSDIARTALEGAVAYAGQAIPLRRVVVIGDTPRDIEAARAIEAVAIMVGTGHYTVDQLRAAGADHVFENLTDTNAILNAVFGC